ncbi:MAG: (d)CMP kinase [Oscillospiraceae bacterium]|nr:(d)CMP kinase [Oscillospiraceae bacterium]
MNEKRYAVAVDGPSGAGKSTLAKAAAQALHITYIDTGAIYRVIGVAARRRGIDPKDEAAVAALLPSLRVGLEHGADGLQRMFLNGEDVTDEIRLPEISLYASAVSAQPKVRAFLLDMQRRFARERSVIMDGRDIGTVVLPDAEVKIFLTADAAVRAQRRFLELEQRGTPRPYDEVLAELQERDRQDTQRAISPLVRAADALTVDTSALDFKQSLALLLQTIREKVGL